MSNFNGGTPSGPNYTNPSADEVGYRPIPEQSPPPMQPFQPQYSPYGQPVVINNTGPSKPTSGMAIAALVLGCVGLIISWWTFGIPSILAIIFGVVGIRQTNANPETQGKGMALAGLITGGAVLAIFILVVLAVTVMGVGAGLSGY